MKIPVILNSEKRILDAKPTEPLLDVLRKNGLLSVKEGCTKGLCGSCTVLLDEKPVSSCIIPVGIVRNATIETLEFFLMTKEGEDIISGFKQAGVNMCGYCNSARVFSTYALLKKVYRPTSEELEQLADCIKCNCTDRKTFINGVIYATANRHEREGRKNGI
ncbi:(2Fe-2S)-binding protein [uncultured Treponema sp.]|uniref:(2Fe-2S)-binding protein n=1 Tax=uncultured Treponema sp. TaxID=162155 RepID=UPI0025DA0417|nr:2Fe-2S iron-sulfur cluster-binding protein [uncultured Treponema sp.]